MEFQNLTYLFWNGWCYNFQCPKSQIAITLKNKTIFLKENLPGDLHIIFYQLTWFEASSCYMFFDIFLTSFQWPNLQREITRRNTLH